MPVLALCSGLLGFSFMLLVLRLLHKSMMDYNRRWQLMRYITGLFICEDAEWAGLPHMDLTEMPHQDEHTGNHIYGW